MKALLVILVHVRHERKFAGRKAHTWVKPFNERVGHDCDGLLNSRTPIITRPHGPSLMTIPFVTGRVNDDVRSVATSSQTYAGLYLTFCGSGRKLLIGRNIRN